MSLTKGKKTETDLIRLLETKNFTIIPASEEEDISEHWDFKILLKDREYKVDVKGVKKINRYDAKPQENYHIVELQNVNGDPGWLYGDCDLFAFETFDYWIFVKRNRLAKFVEESTADEYVNNAMLCLGKKYSRDGRADIMTMVKTIDLMFLASTVVKKYD